MSMILRNIAIIFVDDDGQAYLFWGNGSCKWVKLKENMIELDGPIQKIVQTTEGVKAIK